MLSLRLLIDIFLWKLLVAVSLLARDQTPAAAAICCHRLRAVHARLQCDLEYIRFPRELKLNLCLTLPLLEVSLVSCGLWACVCQSIMPACYFLTCFFFWLSLHLSHLASLAVIYLSACHKDTFAACPAPWLCHLQRLPKRYTNATSMCISFNLPRPCDF